MVICRLGPLVHGGVNAPHSQGSRLCFLLPSNFCQNIYSVQVPFSRGPYLCFHNFKRRRSCVSDTHSSCPVAYCQDSNSSTWPHEWQLNTCKKSTKSPAGNLGDEDREAASSPGTEAQELNLFDISNRGPLWGQWPALPLWSEGCTQRAKVGPLLAVLSALA